MPPLSSRRSPGKITLLLLVMAIMASSCSIEKRTYMPGYSVTWKKRTENPRKIEQREYAQTNEQIAAQEELETISPLIVSNDNDLAAFVSQQKTATRIAPSAHAKRTTNRDENCDILTMRSGNDRLVKVVEITQSEIKYRDCDNLDGPLVTVSKSEVFRIQYANGKVEVMESSNTSSQNTSSGTAQNPIWGILSLVCGIVSIIAPIIMFLAGWLFAIVGGIFGLVALANAVKTGGKKGMAIAGIILSVLGFIVTTVLFFIVLALLL